MKAIRSNQHLIWELASCTPSDKCCAVSCDKVNKEYQVLATASQVKGESGTKGFMSCRSLSQQRRSLIPMRMMFTFYFHRKLNTLEQEMSVCARGTCISESAESQLKYSYTNCTNCTACTLRRKYNVWELQFLVLPWLCPCQCNRLICLVLFVSSPQFCSVLEANECFLFRCNKLETLSLLIKNI